MSSNIVKVGTRGSFLALTQTRTVIKQLSEKFPKYEFELVTISTAGDVDRVTALDKIGGIGLFTKKIEHELLDKNIDVAVHSAKDLPSVMTDGLVIGGALPRRGRLAVARWVETGRGTFRNDSRHRFAPPAGATATSSTRP